MALGMALGRGEQLGRGVVGLRGNGEWSARLEDMGLEELEQFLIKKALRKNDGNVSHAARVLGLSRSALYRRLERYGL